jgi:hypothetical protein
MKKPIKCIIGKHEWQYGQHEGSNQRDCKVCGEAQIHTREEGYVRVPQSRLYRFVFRRIKVKVRSMRERSIEETIEDNQKVSGGELRKKSIHYLVLSVAIGIVVTAIIAAIIN